MVATVVAAAIDGHGGALVVRGEPGIGKSTLLEHARACGGEAAIVEASGVEVEGEVAFAGLTDVLRPVLGALDALTPVQAEAIETILGAARARPPDRLTIGGATLALLAAACGRAAAPRAGRRRAVARCRVAGRSRVRCPSRRLRCGCDPVRSARRRARDLHRRGHSRAPPHRPRTADALELLDGRVPSPQVADTLVDRTGGNPLALLELPAAVTPEQLAGHRAARRPAAGGAGGRGGVRAPRIPTRRGRAPCAGRDGSRRPGRRRPRRRGSCAARSRSRPSRQRRGRRPAQADAGTRCVSAPPGAISGLPRRGTVRTAAGSRSSRGRLHGRRRRSWGLAPGRGGCRA